MTERGPWLTASKEMRASVLRLRELNSAADLPELRKGFSFFSFWMRTQPRVGLTVL